MAHREYFAVILTTDAAQLINQFAAGLIRQHDQLPYLLSTTFRIVDGFADLAVVATSLATDLPELSRMRIPAQHVLGMVYLEDNKPALGFSAN